MWRKTADISTRLALLVSVALYGAAPAAAAIISAPGFDTASSRDVAPMDLPELAPILAALNGIGRQSVDHPGHNPGPSNSRDHFNDKDRAERDILLNRTTTSKIVQDLASIKKECSNYDQVYRIDCLRQGLDMIVASLPDNSEYRQAKRILRQASNRLGRIVSTYKDPAAPKLEVPANANPRFKKRRKYTAIRREAVPEAMAKAQQAVTEATTALLRSSENSERRYAHYQQISVAVDSTKVLLRSS